MEVIWHHNIRINPHMRVVRWKFCPVIVDKFPSSAMDQKTVMNVPEQMRSAMCIDGDKKRIRLSKVKPG